MIGTVGWPLLMLAATFWIVAWASTGEFWMAPMVLGWIRRLHDRRMLRRRRLLTFGQPLGNAD